MGYSPQFAIAPHRFIGIVHSLAWGDSAQLLQEEISSLLTKEAIQIHYIHWRESQSGFCIRYFLMPKKGETGLWPILDQWALNRHLMSYRFRMWTHTALMCFVCPGDRFTSVDLKDDYHIPIYSPHRKYFQCTIYEYIGPVPQALLEPISQEAGHTHCYNVSYI